MVMCGLGREIKQKGLINKKRGVIKEMGTNARKKGRS